MELPGAGIRALLSDRTPLLRPQSTVNPKSKLLLSTEQELDCCYCPALTDVYAASAALGAVAGECDDSSGSSTGMEGAAAAFDQRVASAALKELLPGFDWGPGGGLRLLRGSLFAGAVALTGSSSQMLEFDQAVAGDSDSGYCFPLLRHMAESLDGQRVGETGVVGEGSRSKGKGKGKKQQQQEEGEEEEQQEGGKKRRKKGSSQKEQQEAEEVIAEEELEPSPPAAAAAGGGGGGGDVGFCPRGNLGGSLNGVPMPFEQAATEESGAQEAHGLPGSVERSLWGQRGSDGEEREVEDEGWVQEEEEQFQQQEEQEWGEEASEQEQQEEGGEEEEEEGALESLGDEEAGVVGGLGSRGVGSQVGSDAWSGFTARTKKVRRERGVGGDGRTGDGRRGEAEGCPSATS